MCICIGLGGSAPEASEIIENLVEKSMETCKLFKNCHELWANLYLKKANFNKKLRRVWWIIENL